MLSIAPSAGVDVSQAYLDLGFFDSAKALRVANTQEGIGKIVLALRSKGVSKVGCHWLLWARAYLRPCRSGIFDFCRQSSPH